jgi:hypothetical protein
MPAQQAFAEKKGTLSIIKAIVSWFFTYKRPHYFYKRNMGVDSERQILIRGNQSLVQRKYKA